MARASAASIWEGATATPARRAEGGQMGDAGRFEAPVPDEVPKIEMRKVGDARVSPLHYGDDAAEGV